MPTAVIYIRLSKYAGDAEDPSTSPERQLAACQGHCQANGWEVLEVVRDLDVSGFTGGKRLDRPGIQRIIELLPQVDKIVFLKVDRLARSVSDFHRLAEMAAKQQADLVSVKDGIDLGTGMGRALAGILAIFAELESATISERVTDAKAYLKKVGRYAGGVMPYGYRSAPHPGGKGRTLEIDPGQAQQIRQAAQDVLAGKTTYRIAAEWTAARTDGERWTQSNVRRVLLGDATHGLKAWPAILDKDTSLRLKAALVLTPRTSPQRRATRLLSGLLRCETCDGLLHVGSNGKGVIAYSCRHPHCTRKVSIAAPVADQLVEEWFLDNHGTTRLLDKVTAVTANEQVEILRLGIQECADAMVDGGDLDVLVPRLQGLRADLARAEAEKPQVKITYRVRDSSYADEWPDADSADRRKMLAGELDRIVVAPGHRGKRVTIDRLEFVPVDDSLQA